MERADIKSVEEQIGIWIQNEEVNLNENEKVELNEKKRDSVGDPSMIESSISCTSAYTDPDSESCSDTLTSSNIETDISFSEIPEVENSKRNRKVLEALSVQWDMNIDHLDVPTAFSRAFKGRYIHVYAWRFRK